MTTSDNGDGGTGGDNTSLANGSNVNFAITNSDLIDGLSFGVGAGATEYDDTAVVGQEDGSSAVGFANYTMGSITAGVTLSDSNNARSATGANDGGREVEAYGVAFAINENLSISYNQHNMTYKKVGAGPDVEQESIIAGYTMGGATLAIQTTLKITIWYCKLTMKLQKLVCLHSNLIKYLFIKTALFKAVFFCVY